MRLPSVPAPVPLPVPGPDAQEMARSFRAIRADPPGFLVDVTARHGDRVAFPVPGTPTLLLSAPADVRHVLQTRSRAWTKDTIQYTALARVTGPGLLATADPDWIGRRRTAAPAFHHRRLAVVGEGVRTAARRVLDDPVRGPAASGGVVDLEPVLATVALEAVGHAVLGSDLSADASDLLRASGDTAEYVVRFGRSVVPGIRWVPTPTTVRLALARRRLDRGAARLVERRRAASSGATDGHGDDLLGLLLDSGLDEAAIRDELVTMVVAGHETVAAALCWTLLLLARHPDVQEDVRDELAAAGDGVTLTAPRERTPLTRSVIDESLRLYPPAWAISRRAAEADRIGDLDVPAGTLAIVSPWVVHRRPELWPEPTVFRPERFDGGRVEPGSYLPFGLGPRLCIGREFALGEMVLVLDELLRRYRVRPAPGRPDPTPRARVAVHPQGGMWLELTPLHRGDARA